MSLNLVEYLGWMQQQQQQQHTNDYKNKAECKCFNESHKTQQKMHDWIHKIKISFQSCFLVLFLSQFNEVAKYILDDIREESIEMKMNVIVSHKEIPSYVYNQIVRYESQNHFGLCTLMEGEKYLHRSDN